MLKVWRDSHALTLSIYRITAGFPKTEVYGLTSQLRRAAASVPANIAEGCGRKTSAEFARFLQIAMGSASEVEYHLLLARDLQYLGEADYLSLNDCIVQIKRMLTGLIKRVDGSQSDD